MIRPSCRACPTVRGDEASLKALSDQVLTEELTTRGFEAVKSNADFHVVAKWHKQLSSYAGLFDSVDGPTSTMNRRGWWFICQCSSLHFEGGDL